VRPGLLGRQTRSAAPWACAICRTLYGHDRRARHCVGIYPAQTYARQTRKICPSKCPVTGSIRELPDGLTWIRLAELFGVARSTVYRAIQRAERPPPKKT